MIDEQTPIHLTEESSLTLAVASKGQRLGNYLLDILFVYGFSVVMGIVLYVVGLGDAIEAMNTTLFGLLLFLLYYVPQEAFFGWTIAKLITRTRVVSETGSRISIGQAVVRCLCRFIPFEVFSFLGGDGNPVGWHDKIPKTRVISIK